MKRQSPSIFIFMFTINYVIHKDYVYSYASLWLNNNIPR